MMAFCLANGIVILLQDAWMEIMDLLIISLRVMETPRRSDMKITVELTWKENSTVSEVTGKAKATMK